MRCRGQFDYRRKVASRAHPPQLVRRTVDVSNYGGPRGHRRCHYREFEGLLESEIHFAEETSLRQMLLDAINESDYWRDVNEALEPDEEPECPLAADSADTDKWSVLVDSLRETLLEDYDFDMAEKFLDMPAEQVAALKRQMNIHPDYFVAVIDDPAPEQLAEIRRELWKLLADTLPGS